MYSLVSFLVFCLFFVQYSRAIENGVVGFGISLYQDLCCQACYDSLSTLYLTCTTFDDSAMDMSSMDMDMSMSMGATSADCYATNVPWLQTMAYCIQQGCDAVGYGADKQAKCFSVHAVAGASEPTFQNSLPATAPTVELAGNATWLNETSLVNAELYSSTYGTEGEFARSEYIHTRYSVINYLVIIGICVGGGVLAQARSLFPGFQKQLQTSALWAKLQQYIFLPALFGSRRLEPLPKNSGYVPGRTLTIFISIYVIINLILSSVSFRNFQPNVWFASPQFETCEYIGNRTGTLSLVNLSIEILFASRNNLLIAITGWSQTAFLTLHRWAARVATLQAVVHSIVYTVAYFTPNGGGAATYATQAAMPFYLCPSTISFSYNLPYWGIIATIAMCLSMAFAILPIRINYYEFFLATHIALVMLALIGCWYHIVPHFGYIYGYQVWLYIAFAFWGFERVARVFRLGYYNRLGDSKAIVEAVPGCDIMQVTVFPRVAWAFGPGQHTFLYLSGMGKFWESHPFSIAGWRRKGEWGSTPSRSTSPSLDKSTSEEEKGVHSKVSRVATLQHQTQSPSRVPNQIHFLIRPHSGMTSTLRRRLQSSPDPSSMEISIYNEGPYSGHRATLQPLLLADTVLCIVGGIGITNALGFIQEYKNSAISHHGESAEKSRGIMKKTKRFVLAWSAREMGLIEHVKENFLEQNNDVEGIEYSFWCTHASSISAAQKLSSMDDESASKRGTMPEIISGRMNIGEVMRGTLEAGLQTTVMVCGPGNMVDEATREVVECLKNGHKVDLMEEAFSW